MSPAGSTLKLVIFDCDGTLVDSQDVIVASINATFDSHNLQRPTRAEALSIVGLSLVEAMRKLAPALGRVEHVNLAESYKSAFFEVRKDPQYSEPLYEGALEMVERLAKRDDVLLGIATGKSQRGVQRVLEHHGLKGHFVTIQTADDAPSKPHPGMIARAIDDTGVLPNATIMIGDTTYDMEMAHAAGAYAAGVSWGYHPHEELQATRPHYFAESFQELDGHLEDFFVKAEEASHGQ